MKRLTTSLLLVISFGAAAQSSLTLYGVVDAWTGVQSTASGRQVVLNDGGMSGSRFGLKSVEDLGNGLKMNVVLEQGFKLDTGRASTGYGFSRRSYLGFSGPLGEVRFGRMGLPFDDINGITNTAFDSALSPQNNVWRSADYQSKPGNSIFYETPSRAGLSGAIGYAFPEAVVSGSASGAVISTNLKYEAGPWYAGFAYQTEPSAGSATPKRFTRLNASYDQGLATVLASYGKLTNGLGSTLDWQLGLDIPLSQALKISGGYAYSVDNPAAGGSRRQGYGLAAKYDLSRRTLLYGGFHTDQTLMDASSSVKIFAIGIKHSF